ncbi:Low molecular weight protein-tyrosine-phosphatase Wzb [Salinisphaera sp. LB1]|nr:Low molecular weight protein-tyrosine-phosphatase Wzb [Salinisphaera sp. LB1]
MVSAGIAAVVGGSMPEPAQEIAEREGLDLAHHSGRQLTGEMLREYELVLVMEDRQKQWVEAQFPESRGRVFMITHWRGGDDIRDPYRQSRDVFEAGYAEIAECVADWAVRLDQ